VDDFGALFSRCHHQMFSLQKSADLVAFQQRWPLRELEVHASDVRDTAALIINLDLVIAVDTMTAHLAGALGKPVWILLPSPSDWRWMMSRDDTPWYPTARLFRQARPGDWSTVITEIGERLSETYP
jgi:hypothetical protein